METRTLYELYGSQTTPVSPEVTPSGGPKPMAGELLLPPGRVQCVYVVDPRKRVDGKAWRVSFDLEAFENAPDRPKERVWKGRVMHAVRVLGMITSELKSLEQFPVYVAKGPGDEVEVVLWRHPRNPIVLTEVCGWRIHSYSKVNWGAQCLLGFRPELSVIEDWKKWPR